MPFVYCYRPMAPIPSSFTQLYRGKPHFRLTFDLLSICWHLNLNTQFSEPLLPFYHGWTLRGRPLIIWGGMVRIFGNKIFFSATLRTKFLFFCQNWLKKIFCTTPSRWLMVDPLGLFPLYGVQVFIMFIQPSSNNTLTSCYLGMQHQSHGKFPIYV